MIYHITFLDNNRKSDVYTEGNIHGIYHYLEMIGAQTELTTSVQRSYHFDPSYSINNYISSLPTVISDLCMIQNSICECFGSIGHKDDA